MTDEYDDKNTSYNFNLPYCQLIRQLSSVTRDLDFTIEYSIFVRRVSQFSYS